MKVTSVCAILFGVIGLNDRASAQVPEGYEVVVLANDLGIHSRPEINDRSEVVWSSSFPPPVDRSDAWLYSDGVIRKISDDGGYDINPSINNNSVITWRRCESYFNSGCNLIKWEDGEMAIIATPYLVQQSPKINDANQIVWLHDFSGTADDVELFVTEQGETLQITDDELSNQWPRINSSGDIVWTQFDFSVPLFTTSFMLYSDGVTTQLADDRTHPGNGDINDAGQMTWGSNNGIELWDNGKITVIADGGGSPKINELQHISFARHNEAADRNEVWLHKNDTLYLLSDAQHSAVATAINDLDEVAWRAFVNDSGDTSILMLQEIATAGDFDGNGVIDLRDLRAMQVCFTGSDGAPPGGLLGACTRADFDADGDVDLDDFASFDGVFVGAGGTDEDRGEQHGGRKGG